MPISFLRANSCRVCAISFNARVQAAAQLGNRRSDNHGLKPRGARGRALYGIIYPPQVALVGFGKVVRRPWVVDGAILPRWVVTITLAADHRVSDGHAGALFLAGIGRLLQEPEKL